MMMMYLFAFVVFVFVALCTRKVKGREMKAPAFLYHCALHAGRTALIGRYFNRWLAPPSNVPGSQLGEMALDRRPRDETDVFLLRSTISLTNRRAVGTASLKEMLRNEGTPPFIPSEVREVHAGRL